MTSNIACFVPGCTEPVIGQCQGYEGSCGRFYCAEHSVGALCVDCAKAKLEDDILKDYFKTAEQLKREAARSTGWRFCVYLFILYALLAVTTWAIVSSGAEEVGWAVGGVMFFGGLIGLVIWEDVQRRNYEKAALSRLSETKPGFPEFYRVWKKKKSKEALKTGLAVAAGAAVATAAAIGESSRREERVRDIEEGVRRASR